jgi:DNA-binding NarL/FixJ family response regulator
MKSTHKILIVDDHKLFREGLSFVISQMNGFQVVGEAANGHKFLEMIDELEADIVLMDISMPGIDGVTATTRAMEKYPNLKIIALTMFSDKEYYNKMVKAGVSGFLLKESGKEELARAFKAVLNGEKYFSQKLLHNIILNANISKPQLRPDIHNDINLTLLESEILKLICHGLSTTQISDKLSLSIRAIEGYKSDLLTKTGAKNSINLAVFAMKNKLVEI